MPLLPKTQERGERLIGAFAAFFGRGKCREAGARRGGGIGLFFAFGADFAGVEEGRDEGFAIDDAAFVDPVE